jgi:hypothetical protein
MKPLGVVAEARLASFGVGPSGHWLTAPALAVAAFWHWDVFFVDAVFAVSYSLFDRLQHLGNASRISLQVRADLALVVTFAEHSHDRSFGVGSTCVAD